MRHLCDVDTYAVVGFEYVACLTTCTNSDAYTLVILVAGLTTGTNSNAHLWRHGLTMCTILCVVWRGFGFGLAAPISSSLPPHYILSVRIVGVAFWCDRASSTLNVVLMRGIRVTRVITRWGGNRIIDRYALPVVIPRRQSCASEQIAAASYR